MSALPDQYLTASLVNGLPTCTFTPRPYQRKITNIVIGNGIASQVKCYRGSLTSYPVAQNSLGASNTLIGVITIAAGQQFFVQWSASGSPVSSAFARVSWQRVDSPLDESSYDTSSWSEVSVSSFTVSGPNGAQIIIDAGATYPNINFWSPDHSNSAGISITGGASGADMLATSGTYTPADTIPRRGRLWFDGAIDETILQIIKQSNQASFGGQLLLRSTDMFVGYRDSDGAKFYYMTINSAGGISFVGTSVSVPTSINVSGETWHSPALNAPFTNRVGAFPPFSYRLIAAPLNSLQIVGQVNINGAVNGSTVATLPVGYRPVNEQIQTLNNPGTLTLETNGDVLAFFSAGTILQINALFSLDI